MNENFTELQLKCDHECTRIKTEKIIEKTLEEHFNEQRGGTGYRNHADPFSRKVIATEYHCSICGTKLVE